MASNGALSSGVMALSHATVQAAAAGAVSYWAAHGISIEDVRILQQTRIKVDDLFGPVLGTASETTNSVWIDKDAAGFGWNTNGSHGGVDLLSTITHEFGHLLGFEHDHDTHEVMAETLGIGTQYVTPSLLARTRIRASGVQASFDARTLDDLFARQHDHIGGRYFRAPESDLTSSTTIPKYAFSPCESAEHPSRQPPNARQVVADLNSGHLQSPIGGAN